MWDFSFVNMLSITKNPYQWGIFNPIERYDYFWLKLALVNHIFLLLRNFFIK